MASEADSPVSDPSRISGSMSFSLFPPFIFGFTNPNPHQDSLTSPAELGDRVILINPVTGGVFVIEPGSGRSSSPSSLDSLLGSMFGKDGPPPASRASIEALRSVKIGEEEEEKSECAICLEEWGVGGTAKEMPCHHRFHKECIEKWLGIHGSCPVCRYEMPVEEDDEVKQKSESRWRREDIWLGFTLGDIHQFFSNESEA